MVCVDDGPCKLCSTPVNISKSQVYVVQDSWISIHGRLLVRLIGVDNIECHFANDSDPHGWGFSGTRFRPLDELKQEAKLRQEQEMFHVEPETIPAKMRNL